MEELQDAIEDAQYLNAVHDDTPRPNAPWPRLKDDELLAFIARNKAENPLSVELESICAGALGFFMVSACW